ncbi:hypothetical protein [Sulfuriroseicoccus oceanibius]|uniref:Uncharacterized protein n=1 Tax=Sulfuriroseicoccus oceanibius TaxID=2707525 RepID=A0A7T7F0I7_9BACT|nr:hypothetical protein [Sulfuriroseicoccus oceanibius]QQL44597.1 hypothetical protein G3M56_012000 [Sulfuriroseicoccus oceanibius]
MRISIPIILLLVGTTPLYSDDICDPFKAHDPQMVSDCQASDKLTSIFTCISSGTLQGSEISSRSTAIISTISKFHEKNHRVPHTLAELRSFAKLHGFDLLDLQRLSQVVFDDGMFHYSATYARGTLTLSHLPDRLWSSAPLDIPEVEQVGAANRDNAGDCSQDM